FCTLVMLRCRRTAVHDTRTPPRSDAKLSNCLGFSSDSVVYTGTWRVLYRLRAGTLSKTHHSIFGQTSRFEANMKKSRPILWLSPSAAVAVAASFGWQRFYGPDAAKTQTAQKGPPRPIAVPVTIAPVQQADFPVYLTGLGTVQGFNTVQVRTRVDGQIDKIAFQEAQLVKEADLLAEIDPRPFQAVLDQAKAKKEQDEANRANANLYIQRSTKA